MQNDCDEVMKCSLLVILTPTAEILVHWLEVNTMMNQVLIRMIFLLDIPCIWMEIIRKFESSLLQRQT